MIKPLALKEGDKVATISLSWGGPGAFPHRYEAGKKQLRDAFGLNIVETPNALKPAEWVYNNPKARADDLMQAFADSSIKAIISTIGGEESVRILPYLDLKVIRDNPKIFLGYTRLIKGYIAIIGLIILVAEYTEPILFAIADINKIAKEI